MSAIRRLKRAWWRWRLQVVEAEIQGHIASGDETRHYASRLYQRAWLLSRLGCTVLPVAYLSLGGPCEVDADGKMTMVHVNTATLLNTGKAQRRVDKHNV